MYVSIVSPRLSRPELLIAVPPPTLHVARTAHTDRPPAAQLFYSVIVASPHFTSHTWKTREEKKSEKKKLYKSQQGPHPHFRVWPCRAIFSLPIASHQISCPIARLLAQLDKDPPQESPRFLHTFISRYLYIVTSHPPLLHAHAHAHTHTRTQPYLWTAPSDFIYSAQSPTWPSRNIPSSSTTAARPAVRQPTSVCNLVHQVHKHQIHCRLLTPG